MGGIKHNYPEERAREVHMSGTSVCCLGTVNMWVRMISC